MGKNSQYVMDKETLHESVKYLVEKYLPTERAEYALNVFSLAVEPPYQASPKDFLSILSNEKIHPFDKDDANLVKDVAFNLGI